jgi:hypothetical protein
MEKQREDSGSEDTHIRSLVDQIDKIELVDTLGLGEEALKQEVTLPYLSGLYEDLILRSDAIDKGIPRVVLTEV